VLTFSRNRLRYCHPTFAPPHFSTVALLAGEGKLSAGRLILRLALLRRLPRQDGESDMELAVVIVVLVVAGAMIPGNPKIHFFR